MNLQNQQAQNISGQVHEIFITFNKEETQELFSKAMDYEKKKELEQAKQLYNQILDILSKFNKKNTLQEASVLNNLGNIQKQYFKFNEAVDFYKKSLQIKQKCEGALSIACHTTYTNLARVYHSHKKYKESTAYFQKALQISKIQWGEQNSNYLFILKQISKNLFQAEFYKQALDKIEDYYKVLTKIEPNNTFDYLTAQRYVFCLQKIFESQQKQFQYLESRDLFNLKQPIKSEMNIKNCCQLKNLLESMIYEKHDKFQRALKYYKKLFSILEESYGKHHQKSRLIESIMKKIQLKTFETFQNNANQQQKFLDQVKKRNI